MADIFYEPMKPFLLFCVGDRPTDLTGVKAWEYSDGILLVSFNGVSWQYIAAGVRDHPVWILIPTRLLK